MAQFYEKDPGEAVWLGWTWDVSPYTLASSTWAVPEGIVATDASYSGTDGIFDDATGAAQVKISGGTLGDVYRLTNQVTTSNGETFEDTIIVVMVSK